MKIFLTSTFTFSHASMVEKELFLGQIFEMKFMMNLHILKVTNFENHIFYRLRLIFFSFFFKNCLLKLSIILKMGFFYVVKDNSNEN